MPSWAGLITQKEGPPDQAPPSSVCIPPTKIAARFPRRRTRANANGEAKREKEGGAVYKGNKKRKKKENASPMRSAARK